MTKKRIESIVGVFALIIIIAAWYIGTRRADTDIIMQLKEACNETSYIVKKESNIFEAFKNKEDTTLYAYLVLNSASGYGGKLQVLTIISPAGTIIDTKVINHKETYSFLKKVKRKKFSHQFKNKPLTDNFILKDDINAVSGATFTTKAYNEAVRKSVKQTANDIFELNLTPYTETRIIFGKYEIVWIVFLIIAFVSVKIKTRKTKLVRWIILLSGMVVIGFIYNIPLSIGLMNKALLGFWPPLNRQLYFYIMLGGTFLIILFTNKNLYCERICPFGATQECISVISGTKRQLPKKIRNISVWIQRLLALGVIVLALVMRKPGYANYEVFGTMFRLTGGHFSFILLLIFLILSLVLLRPWCNFICPVGPVTDYIRMIRRWIISLNSK